MIRKYNYFYLIVLAMLVSSCYPDAGISPAETDTVRTSFVSGTDFSLFTYYQIADSVIRIDNEGNVYYEWMKYDEAILNQVDKNLQTKGYLNIADFPDSIADFNVVVSDLSAVQISYYWSYFPYGSYYWGSEQANGYYPMPPPDYMFVSATSYIMVDITDSDPILVTDIPIYWRGIAQGIYSSEMGTRITNSIDIMFIQSSYLSCLEI
ncbi:MULTISPECIES: DUF4136 domain-containing protein [unclassified Lentimicrobium]|uniref:DUF4136 domain-containing protein n=1 Tax=unclassified Lentimicrobium TaxID=2677434 RepID=UPI001551BA5E|nr:MULTISPECIES: DUF4136 domain-containing protein [unclassified Lentimicrobium]NPD45207.1 DUF4136 domain-containing protein [Lentimicrobium sp. S6]NPD86577.1 DUF4136 domain-containing protein [Lentimicrobium sp. L6]